MPPAQKAQQTAYNEFIADYVERHGECKATRDEAHHVADWIVTMVGSAVTLCEKYATDQDVLADAASDLAASMIDAAGSIDGKDEAKFLAACAIAAALEVVA